MLTKNFLKYPAIISLFIATSSFAVVQFSDKEVPRVVYTVEEVNKAVELPPSTDVITKPINYQSQDYKYDLSLLTEVLFHEARGDDYTKVFAVIMNRLHHRLFGSTIHEVVHKPHQFSYLTDHSYTELRMIEKNERSTYNEIRAWVHKQLRSGKYVDETGGALYYYAYNKMSAPNWWGIEYATIETAGHRFATWHLVK